MKKLLTLLAVVLALTAIAGIALAVDVPEGSTVAWGHLDSITTIAGHKVDISKASYTVPATCTQTGCAVVPCLEGACDKGFAHIVYIAPGHVWSSTMGPEWGNIIEVPTCTSTGLAIDVCMRCKITNPDKTRVIAKLPHVYDPTEATPPSYVVIKGGSKYLGHFVLKSNQTDLDMHYAVITAPTCVSEGDAWRVCTKCGHVDKDYKVSLRVLPHAWTDWNLVKAPTCLKSPDGDGYAIRACASCGANQILTKDLDEKTWTKLCAPKNQNWSLENILAGKCEYEVVREEDWLTTCYTHNVVYICPYCKCDEKVLPKTPHKKITNYDQKLVSHIWKTSPEGQLPCTVSTTGLWNEATDKARQDWAWNNECSIAPTCLYDGFDLYKCIYDGKETSDWKVTHKTAGDPFRFKMIRIPATGHKLSDWELAATYTLKGETVYQWIRHCSKCGVTESKVTWDAEGDEDTDTAVLEAVSLNKTTLKLKVGQEKTLKVKIQPANAETKVKWKSSRKSVAKVLSDGTVIAQKKGTATITVTATCKVTGTTLSATCKVTVK